MPLRGKITEYKTKTDLVYDYLEAALLDGDLKPGEQLSVDAIARDLGISKIPVREAVQRLINIGLITQNPHSGPVVVTSSEREIEGTYLVRRSLEGMMAELAAPLIGDEPLSTLDQITAQMYDGLDGGSARDLSALNREFHMTIAAASGYRIFPELSHMLLLRVSHYRNETPVAMDAWREIIVEHEAIIRALRAGDADAARKAATDHVDARFKTDRST